MALSPIHIKFLQDRNISLKTATTMGVYSAKREQDGTTHENEKGNILVFPFFKEGQIVNEKFRAPGKRFWQTKDGHKCFYNRDILNDVSVVDGTHPLVITEGELDCLAVIEAGYPYCVSVPDGAPPARDATGMLIDVPDGTQDIDTEHDDKYSFIMNDWEALARVPRIVIATDSDEPGQRLAKELVRRLDKIRCSFVTYPADCKDFNAVLMEYNVKVVLNTIAEAKPYPVSGVYGYDDLPEEPEIGTVSTGWENLDPYVKPYSGAFMVITGLPGQGKSTFSTQLVANLAYLQGWTVGIASFEMRLKPYVTDQIRNAFIRLQHIYPHAADNAITSEKFLQRRFCFIAPDPEDDTEHDIDWLIERMSTAVIRYGMRVCIIDPWNEIEHKRNRDETTTEYVGRAIRMIKKFARRFDCLVIVVAHPDKAARNKDLEDIGLMDISDSAHWANKADIGVTVARLGDDPEATRTGIYVKKIRYQPEGGQIGEALMDFDRSTRLFRLPTE